MLVSSWAEKLKQSETTPIKQSWAEKLKAAKGVTGGAFETTTGNQQGFDAMQPVSPSPNPLGFLDSAKIGLADDIDTQIRAYAAKRFPSMPLAQAIKRYGVRDNEIVYVDDQGQVRAEVSGIGANVGNFVGSTGPAMMGGTLGGLVGGPLGAGAGAAAGEGYRKTASSLLLDEPQTAIGNVADMGGEGLLNAAGWKLGDMWVNKHTSRRVAQDIDKLNIPAAQDLQRKAATEGIDLSPAEMTDLGSLKTDQMYLQKNSSTADTMGAWLKNRAEQVKAAIERHIPGTPPLSTVGAKGVEAAQASIAKAKGIRSDLTSPMYEAAKAGPDVVDVAPLLSHIDKQLVHAKGGIADSLGKARAVLMDSGGNPDASVAGLHQAKLAIDDMITGVGDKAISTTAKGELTTVKNMLLDALNTASPDYAVASKLFAYNSPIIDKFMDSIVGNISKLKGRNQRRAAMDLFNPNTTSDEIALARRLIGRENPKAWDDLLNTYLRTVWDKASKDSAVGAASNAAGNFRKNIFGDAPTRRRIKAAMGTDRYNAFSDLMDVLQASGRVSSGQSITEFARQTGDEMTRRAAPIASVVINFRQWYLSLRTDAFKQKMADVITSPNAMAMLPELRRLPKASHAARSVVAVALIRSGAATADELFNAEADKLPQFPQASP